MQLDSNDLARLKDMLVYAKDAVSLLGKRTREQMVDDLATRLALVRCIEVVGEACHEVSEPVQLAMPTVPWHAMYGMRNRLIHDYGNTNYQIVFDVVYSDLPVLIEQVEGFLRKAGGGPL